jgi:putative ABC transport system permease protein
MISRLRKVRWWLQRRRRENELREELEFHLAEEASERNSAGLPINEARWAARRDLGNVTLLREEVRRLWSWAPFDQLTQDVRYALRGFKNAPGFTLVVVVMLAFGIGANAAIFSLLNQALLRQLPVPAPKQLVNLLSPGPRSGRSSTSSTFNVDAVFSYPLYRDIERTQTAFTGVATHRDFVAHIAYRDRASTETGLLVSGSYFPVLSLQPELGRLLGAEDDRIVGVHRVVVVSHTFWRDTLGGNPAVISDTLVINGQTMTIIGVTPEEFVGTTIELRPSIFVPVTMAALMMPGLQNPHVDGQPWNGFEDRRDHWLYLFARLKSGIARETAEQAVNIPFGTILREVDLPAQRGLSETARERFKSRRLVLEPGQQGQRPERAELGGVFQLLFSISGIVLLISCANIAGLQLARSASRQRDVTIRLSLGAARSRLISQMLTESFLLAVLGTVAGFIVAGWTLRGLMSLVPAQTRSIFRFEIDAPILTFGLTLSVAVTLLFGLYPAFATTRRDLAIALKTAGPGSRSTVRFRTWLVAAQVALSLALLVVAGLFTRSLLNMSRIELGMRIADVTTFRLSPELNGYGADRSRRFFEQLEEAFARLPGVTSVGTSTVPVLAGVGVGNNVTVEGFTAGPDTNTSGYSSAVGPGYFRTLGIPLIAGREFTASDNATAPKVAVVNEAFARKFNLVGSTIGKRMFLGAGRRPFDIEIVGLVKDARYSQLKDAPPPLFFLPYRQRDGIGALNFYVQSSIPSTALLPIIRSIVNPIDPTLPIENLRSMESQARDTVVLDRLISALTFGFAGLAALLAGIGLYGLLAYSVVQRTPELGLRIALGASVGRIGRMMCGQVGRLVVIGSAFGVGAALILGRFAESQLFEVSGVDIRVIVVAVAGIALIALIAALIPAWRAARVDPMVALRCE